MCDIINPVNYEGNIDFIIHLASNTHPKQYGEDPVGTITTNVIGCNNLLKLAVEKKAKFILASSVEIYGQGSETPMTEMYSGYIDCNTYRSGYNESKRTCEALCQSYKKQYGVESSIVRFARVFGADVKEDTKAMSQFLNKAAKGENIVLKSRGNQKYSYCYVADAASGLIKILIDGLNGEAYNISDEYDGMTLGEYAEYIASLAGKKVIYEIENDEAASRSSFALLDISKIKALGWTPEYSVKNGLKRTYEILKDSVKFKSD
jgi:nucleoside-diphosphate-sugar epimerase